MFACELKVFDKIIWLDKNPNIAEQLKGFVALYGPQFELFNHVEEGVKLAQENPEFKYIVVCSSRLVGEVKQSFKNVMNVYPQCIVFCGSAQTAQKLMVQYPQDVYAANFDIVDVMNSIERIEQSLNIVQKKGESVNHDSEKVVCWIKPASQIQGLYQTFKRLNWQHAISVRLFDEEDVKSQLQDALQYNDNKYIIVSTAEFKGLPLLGDFQNLDCWIKYLPDVEDSKQPALQYLEEDKPDTKKYLSEDEKDAAVHAVVSEKDLLKIILDVYNQ